MADLMIAVDIRATVLKDIASERVRQVTREGYNEDHDDEENSHKELARAAGCYAIHSGGGFTISSNGRHNEEGFAVPVYWPERWDDIHWKPKDDRSNLVRAAALLVAEIERLDRARLRELIGEAKRQAGF